jgi:hypothetical protein
MDTLLLDASTWDLALDADGNIAVASNPYSLAQDAASAIKTFLGEVYYDTTVGVPYLTEILGKMPPLALLIEALQKTAKTVPDVDSALCILTQFDDRRFVGQVQVTSVQTGETSVATFTVINPQGA